MTYRLAPRASMTPEQLERRRATLGSSEIAAIVGVNPYQSQHEIWVSKVLGQHFAGNEATLLGQLVEPAILDIYADRYDCSLTRGAYMLGPEPWISCTPDAWIGAARGNGLVEAKLVGLRSLWQWGSGNTDTQESDAVPLHYLCQAQWQLIVTGEPFVDVAALLGTEYRTYRIRPNAAVQTKLLDRARDFWTRYVLTQTPPPVDGTTGATSMLKALYPRSGGEMIAADADLEQKVERLALAREALERATEENRRRENEIKDTLKDAHGAFGEGWRIRYATTKAGTRPFVYEPDKEKGRAA